MAPSKRGRSATQNSVDGDNATRTGQPARKISRSQRLASDSEESVEGGAVSETEPEARLNPKKVCIVFTCCDLYARAEDIYQY